MLELELLLLPFVDSRLETLSDAERRAYAELLECDDWDIFDWIQGRSEPSEPELVKIVATIQRANHA
jgi:antitoxin CptB